MLELAEEAFDQITLPVDASIDRAVHETLGGRGDMGLSPAGPDQVEQRIGIVATVGDDVATGEPLQQARCCAQIMILTGGQDQLYR